MQSAQPSDEALEARRARIRDLNDALRSGKMLEPEKCTVVLTQGVNALGLPFILAATDAIKRFDEFTPVNDPYGERDFGSVDVEGETVFWKIDAYDRSLRFGSPDPADPDVTHRVLTIMLSSEY